MKFLFNFCLFFFFFTGTLLSQKPIAQMVNQAKSSGISFVQADLFSSVTRDVNTKDDLAAALSKGILLQWDNNLVQRLRTLSGQAVLLTLPFENGGTIALELVPAKNFSQDFQVHLGSTGQRYEAYDKGTHFWGIVKGDQATLACISVYDQEVIGLISTANGQYVIGAVERDPQKTHILYKDDDLKKETAFECETDDELHQIGKDIATGQRTGPTNCVRMFIECDYTLFQNKGSVANVVTYMTGVMSQVTALYTNESVNLVLHDLLVWDVTDPYTGPTASNYLTQFRTAKNGVYNGDLAHLVGIHSLGGVAYLDVLCYSLYGVGYSSVYASYSNVPTYSWSVEVMTHEIGHNLGSSHTHSCVWNGNNTAIDGCGPAAGYSDGCNAPLPTNGGTIMSYCHLLSNVGINFNNGFGPQPGDRIRNEVYNAACLVSCDTTGGGGGGPDTCVYVAVNSQNFESALGIWKDGGADCERFNSTTYANSPAYSVRLRDNTNSSTLFIKSNQDWTGYDEITVNFSYITVSFENNEDFWLQISTNGGSTYTTIADFNAGTEFTNGVRGTATVVIPGPFTSTMRLQLRADASADDDQVYIDDIEITGCELQSLTGGLENRNQGVDLQGVDKTGTAISQLNLGPNPADDVVHLMFLADQTMEVTIQLFDLAGRMAMEQTTTAVEGDNNISLSLGQLPEGVYLVQVTAGADRFTRKLVLSR
jgi:hypothetical protein